MSYTSIKHFFSSITRAHISNDDINHLTTLPWYYISDTQLLSEFNYIKTKSKKSIQDKIAELEKLNVIEDRSDESILSIIDPDLIMLYNVFYAEC